MRWRRFRLATQAPEQVASHDVGDHGNQHQKHRNPKNPAVLHTLPARTMRMSIVVFVIMPGLVHGFLRKLRIRKEEVRIRRSLQTIRTDCFSKQREGSVRVGPDPRPAVIIVR